MNKINYYKKSLEEIERIKEDPRFKNRKPTILVHACCGPCSTFPIHFLSQYFEVTVLFNNSNIYPEEEYYKRLETLNKFVSLYGKDNQINVQIITKKYENDKFNEDLEAFKDESEGLNRCRICYKKRIEEAFEYAADNDFDYVCTVMTISRQKSSAILNTIALDLESKYPNTKYFYSDFKKNGGIDKGKELRVHYDLYQQVYCGCKYTYCKLQKKLATN